LDRAGKIGSIEPGGRVGTVLARLFTRYAEGVTGIMTGFKGDTGMQNWFYRTNWPQTTEPEMIVSGFLIYGVNEIRSVLFGPDWESGGSWILVPFGSIEPMAGLRARSPERRIWAFGGVGSFWFYRTNWGGSAFPVRLDGVLDVVYWPHDILDNASYHE